MTHIAFERLSELAEAPAGAGVAREDEARHMAACAECRATISRVRALLAAAQSLPRDVAPPDDAWSGIRQRVTARSFQAARARSWPRWMALAASVVFIAGAALLIPGRANRTGNPLKAKAAEPVASLAAVARVDRRYTATLAELHEALDEQRAQFGPVAAAVPVVDQSLAVIDTAIAEARAALASDPHNPTLVEILSANYQRKVELLRRATELARSS